jgi:hypothetical protein
MILMIDITNKQWAAPYPNTNPRTMNPRGPPRLGSRMVVGGIRGRPWFGMRLAMSSESSEITPYETPSFAAKKIRTKV